MRNVYLGRAAALAAATALLIGCQGKNLESLAKPETVTAVQATDTDLQPVAIAAVIADIRRGTEIGEFVYRPLQCDPLPGKIEWGIGNANVTTSELVAVVSDYMRGAGVLPVNDPGSVFGEQVERKRPKYWIGGAVQSAFVNGCFKTGLLGRGQQSGDGMARVKWTVLEADTDRVVFEMEADGFFELDSASNVGIQVILEEAIGRSAEKLALNPEFRAVIAQDPLQLARERDDLRLARMAPMEIEALPLSDRPIEEQMRDVRASVVQIRSTGGHGSGVLIDPELVLTNHHVVGEEALADVVLASGRMVIGEVVRRHEARDIALIKIEPVRFPYRPIRLQPPEIGESIFIVGSPLRETNQGVVTRGIVSQYTVRQDGLTDMIYDARIYGGNSGGPIFDRFGNIVALVYASQVHARETTQINLGVPIAEGLEFVKIDVERFVDATAQTTQ